MDTRPPFYGWFDEQPVSTGAVTYICGIVAAVGLGATTVGTGGQMSLERSQYPWHETSHYHVTLLTETVRNVQENLQHIRNVLKLAVSDIALAFNVTRQAVYNWLNGEAVAEGNVTKIEALAGAAEILQSAGVNVTASHLKRKFVHGKTLLQVSQSGGDVRDAAHLLVQTLAKETAQRERLKSRTHVRVRSVAMADFDLPVSSN